MKVNVLLTCIKSVSNTFLEDELFFPNKPNILHRIWYDITSVSRPGLIKLNTASRDAQTKQNPQRA